MRILALEPYYDGSHKQFLDGWIARSDHDWTLLTLPGYFWKWRMRHAPLTFARQLQADGAEQSFDAIFCSDMLDVPAFLGLQGRLAATPVVLYFHENQLTYPVREESQRDLHFAMTNFLSAVRADQVWFNTRWHSEVFLSALDQWFSHLPDHSPADEIEPIRRRVRIQAPGIDIPAPRGPRMPGPLRIGWVGRWEHDKNPEAFFAAIDALARRGCDFRLQVLGQSFRDVPEVFDRARNRHADRIDRWGYAESCEEYLVALGQMDVVVSTADHEFFGIAAAEAVAAGALPLLPDRLAYPELVSDLPEPARDLCLYASEDELVDRLAGFSADLAAGGCLPIEPGDLRVAMRRLDWATRAPAMDAAMETLRKT